MRGDTLIDMVKIVIVVVGELYRSVYGAEVCSCDEDGLI